MSAVLQKRQNIYVWIAARQVPHPQGNVFRLHSLGSRSCTVLCRCATPGTSDNGCLSTGYGRICSTSGLKWPQRPLLQVPQPKLSPAVPSSLVTSCGVAVARLGVGVGSSTPEPTAAPTGAFGSEGGMGRCRRLLSPHSTLDFQQRQRTGQGALPRQC